MGRIEASCGHEITMKWFDNPNSDVKIREKNKDGKDIIKVTVLCEECREKYKQLGLLVE